MSSELNLAQRRVRNAVIIQMCRGFYDEALQTLRKSVPLPPLQGQILKCIVFRMMNPEPGEEIPQEHLDAIGKNKDIIEQLQKHGQDTSIGESVVRNVYEKALVSSFKNFRTHLLETQSVEHSKIHQALILCESCSHLALAQQKIDGMGRCVWVGYNEMLFLLCALVFVFIALFFVQQRLSKA